MPLELQSDIRYLKGVGESRAQLYHKLGVDTVEDLLYHIPRRYVDLTHPTPLAEAIPGQKCAVRALLAAKGREQRIRRGLSVFRLTAVDGPVTLHITFFNAKYTVDSLREGEEYLFYGTLTGGFYARQMDSPQVFRPEEAGTLLPVYPLTQGLSNKIGQPPGRRSPPPGGAAPRSFDGQRSAAAVRPDELLGSPPRRPLPARLGGDRNRPQSHGL